MVVRRSTHIGHKAAQSVYYAIGEQAERIGLPLTQHVTINFSQTDLDPVKAVEVFTAIRRNRFDKWSRRPRRGAGRAFVPAYAYVFENARDGVAFEQIGPELPHNVHVHWAVNIPAERVNDFSYLIFQWLDEHCQHPCEANAVKMTTIGTPKGLRRYVLSGTDEKWAKRYGASYEPQGVIIGKRSGVSVNLGPSLRRHMDQMDGIRRQAA